MEFQIVIILLSVNVLIALVILLRSFFKGNKTKQEQEFQQLKNDISAKNSDEFAKNRDELNNNFSVSRMETQQLFASQQKTLQDFGDRNEQKMQQMSQQIDDKMLQLKNSMLNENRDSRQEQLKFQKDFQDAVNLQLTKNREEVDSRLKDIQKMNIEKLDEMKKTVDDKLQDSMDKHFNESFKLISERLEQVHKGLGEMQNLAEGVGDLRKVLTNVKARGNIGEIQLGVLLEQYLSPEQYEKNKVIVPQSKELVEYAIRFPGHKGDEPVYLPVDSKFPVEDYQRLLECYENFASMSPEVKNAQKSFVSTVRKCANDIKTKYIYPPISTGFALMFVPSEGIYAEILRQPGLVESLMNEYQISVVGPSNLVAFLNSLQMGFRTLAIEKHSTEVWQILGAVKTEFNKFGNEMEATRKSLESVVNHVEKIGTRTRAVERKLRSVHELTVEETQKYFPINDAFDSDDE